MQKIEEWRAYKFVLFRDLVEKNEMWLEARMEEVIKRGQHVGDDDNEHYGIKIEPLNFILLRSVESKMYACV